MPTMVLSESQVTTPFCVSFAVFHDDVNRGNSVAGLAVRIDLKTWLGANIVIKGRQEFKLG